jgi:hypothetical protein
VLKLKKLGERADKARNCKQMPTWARRWTRVENASRFIAEIP